jgi:DNA-binding protein YbaB
MSRSLNPDGEFFTPEDFPAVDVEEDQRIWRQLADLKHATYVGRDAEHLVSVVIDGEAMVNRIRFSSSSATRPMDVVERAIAAAFASAQSRLDLAARAVVGPTFPHLAAPAAEPLTDGGIEMAYDPEITEAGDA